MPSVQREQFTDVLYTVSSVRYPMSNFSMSDPLPFVRSFVQCPVSNLSVSNPLSNVQCPATRVAGEGGYSATLLYIAYLVMFLILNDPHNQKKFQIFQKFKKIWNLC